MVLTLVRAAVACEPVDAPELARDVADAERAILELHIDAFVDRQDAIRAALACLDDVVPADLVARIHRLEGARRFGEGDPRAAEAFAAARATDPAFVLPLELAPIGSPFRDAFDALDLDASSSRRLPPPANGTLYVDGRPSRERPDAWPALIQLVDGRTVRWTVYRDPHEPLPTYEATPARGARGPARRRR